MYTIVVHTPKGGVGRTAMVMALANGLLGFGQRVLIVDFSNEAMRARSVLRDWAAQLREDGFDQEQVWHVEFRDPKKYRDCLAGAASKGFDVAVINTSRDLSGDELAVIAETDLFVCPAIGRMEAEIADREFVGRYELHDRAVGLVNTTVQGAFRPQETLKAFGTVPVLATRLPWLKPIDDMPQHGDLGALAQRLACRPGQPGYADYQQAVKALKHVRLLAAEVLWRLDGQALELRPASTDPELRACA